jgi:uncharacterized protein (DUF934 family)
MPALINSSKLIEDTWVRLTDDQAVGDHKNVVVSLGRLVQYWDELISLPVNLGVELEPGIDIEGVLNYLDQLQIIVLQFKVFSDGRAFSQARLLRERYAFSGDIRAVGDVICDQLWFMKRNGFNQFELAMGEDIDLAFKTFSQISLTYQTELQESCLR